MADDTKKSSNHSYIFGESNHTEKGRKNMGRKTSVTASLFIAAAMAAFGLSSTSAWSGEKYWTGNGADQKWSTGDNWGYVNIAADSNSLVFDSRGTKLNVEIDGDKNLRIPYYSGMTVNGNYSFWGNKLAGKELTITGSDHLVTFNNEIDFSSVTVDNGGQLALARNSILGNLEGNGVVEVKGITATLTGNYSAFNGKIRGTGGVKVGNGIEDAHLTLTRSQEYTGDTYIDNYATLQLLATSDTAGEDVWKLGSSKVKVMGAGELVLTASDHDGDPTSINFHVNGLEGNGEVDLTQNTLVIDNGGRFEGRLLSDKGGGIDVNIVGSTSTFELTQVQDYNGATQITKGTFRLMGNGSVAASSGVNVSGNGTFDIAASSTEQDSSIKNLNGAVGGKVQIGANRNLTITEASANQFDGVISGTGSLTLDSSVSGMLTLTNVNTYTGDTDILAGTLKLVGRGNIDPFTDMYIGRDGKFDISTATNTNNIILKSLSGAEGATVTTRGTTVDGDSPQTLEIRNGHNQASEGWGGNITGMDKVVLGDGSPLNYYFTGANTYAGETDVKSGSTLYLDGAGSIAGSDKVNLNGSALDITKVNTTAGLATDIKALDADNSRVLLGSKTLNVKGNETTMGQLYGGSVVTGGTDSAGAPAGTFYLNGTGKTAASSKLFTVTGNGSGFANTNVTVDNATLSFEGNRDISNSNNKLILAGNGVADISKFNSGIRGSTFYIDNFDTSSTSKIVLGKNNVTFTKGGTLNANVESDPESELNPFTNEGMLILNTAGKTSLADKTLTIGADQSYKGGTKVQDGILDLNGKTLSSDVDVDADGVFVGSGTVNGDVTIDGGTFRNPADTTQSGTALTVKGDYTQYGGNIELGTFNSGANVTATGTVALNGSASDGHMTITANNTYGQHTLFTGGYAYNGFDLDNINVVDIYGHAITGYSIRTVDDTSIVLTIVPEGALTQWWRGDDTETIWGGTNNAFWSDSEGSTDRNVWLKTNDTGGIAVFGGTGGITSRIEVDGAQFVDSIIVNSRDRTFWGDDLVLAPATDKNYATIDTGGKIVHFENSLAENRSETKLHVSGGGTVILGEAGSYTGDTVIQGATTLELRDTQGAGYANDIVFSSSSSSSNDSAGGTLRLNAGGQYDYEIVDNTNNTSVKNRVEIAADSGTVTLMNGNNNYKSVTVVNSDATLESGVDGALSGRSFHELNNNSTLHVANGDQEIAGFSGASNGSSIIDIDGGSSLYVRNTDYSDITYNGHLTGNGNFIAAGTKNITLTKVITNSVNSAENFTGAFSVASGNTLTLQGNGSDMKLNLGGNNGITSSIEGTIKIIAGAANVNLAERKIDGDEFNGKVDLVNGNLILDGNAANVLDNNNVELAIGAKGYAAMDVNGNQTINNLTLGGGDISFTGGTLSNTTPYLTVNRLNVANDTVLYLDNDHVNGPIENSGLLAYDEKTREYLIKAKDGIIGSGNIDVHNADDQSLVGLHDRLITRNGSENGNIVVNGVVGRSPNSATGEVGIYLEQELLSINSWGDDNDVLITDADVNTGKSTIDLDAELTGDGGFEFAGSRNIRVNNEDNSYYGNSVVNMNTQGASVILNADQALGNTNLLAIQRGTVNMNGYDLTVGAIADTKTGEADGSTDGALVLGNGLNLDGGRGELTITGDNYAPDSASFSGKVSGFGDIFMDSMGDQIFSNSLNNLNGTITQNGGYLAWAGTLSNTSSLYPALDVVSGEFRQLNSKISGNVRVQDTGAISGQGKITGNLDIEKGGSYIVTATNGRGLDTTTVTNETNFENGAKFAFSNDAKRYMLENPLYERGTIIDSKVLNIDSGNAWYNNGEITYNMGFYGTATLYHDVKRGDLVYQGFERAVDPKGAIKSTWAEEGINVSDIVDRSSLGNAAYNLFINNILDPDSEVGTNKVLNARFANAEVIGHAFERGDYNFSKRDVLSMMNYESGYTSTLTTQAALDTARTFVGQGIKNRINNLRAARSILADAVPGLGYGVMQPTGAYGSTIVQDTFGYNVPGYLGAVYYDPYTGMPQQAAAQAGYGYQQQQGGYSNAPVYGPGYSSAFSLWAGGIGNWNKQKTSGGGITGYTYDAGGLMVGLDHLAGPFVVGGAFGFSRGTLEDEESISSNTKINAYSFNLYGDYNMASGINAMLFGGYTWMENKVSRTVAGYRDTDYSDETSGLRSDSGSETGKYKGHEWHIGANLSYDWIPMDCLTVTPSIGVEYYDARTKSHTRNLNRQSGVTLTDNVSAITGRSLTAPIDLNVTYDVIRKRDTKLSVLGNVGYAYEFHNKGPKGSLTWADVADAQTVGIYGRKPGRNGFNAGIGARLQKNAVSFDLKYDFYKRSDNTAHRLAANVGWDF